MINQWITQFHDAWKNHDIDTVIKLFTDDAEYWETPFKKLRDKTGIREEWQAILDQDNIEINWELFNSSNDNRHSAIWHLQYSTNGMVHASSGVYLIRLNDLGLCDYFYYLGEEKS